MDKAYDHENSEVLLCKLRRANNKESGRGDVRDRAEGKKEGAACVVDDEAAETVVSAAGAGDTAEGDGSAVGAKTLCSDKGDTVSICVGAAATEAAAEGAATAADGLSLTEVSLSPSLSSSVAGESAGANGGSPNGGAKLAAAVTGGNPVR